MTQMGKKGNSPVSAKPISIGEFEAFYETEYSIVVKLLVFLGASAEEANDAAQKAMTDLYRRLKSDKNAIASPEPWVRRAAHRYFIKDRQRERDRLSHEIQAGHPWLEASYADNGLTAWEDEQYIEQLLEVLTPTQRTVLRQVLNGMTTYEIAEGLGKREENIRQQLKNCRDRLKLHPEIAPRAPLKPPLPAFRHLPQMARAGTSSAEEAGQ